jgi:hypothetical protein
MSLARKVLIDLDGSRTAPGANASGTRGAAICTQKIGLEWRCLR